MSAGSERTERWQSRWRRRALWIALAALLVILLAMLVWLSERYETSQIQSRLDRDAARAVTDIRSRLTNNLQSLLALQVHRGSAQRWHEGAAAMLREHRELLGIEWRDSRQHVRLQARTPYRLDIVGREGRDELRSEVEQACRFARQAHSAAYAPSSFLVLEDGLGVEVMDVCLPLTASGEITGYLVATYSLPDLLGQLQRQLRPNQEVSFTEGDGTRLAVWGMASRAARMFVGTRLLDLPGFTLVLRIEGWHRAPALFPNLLTALVVAMSIMLVLILVLLGKDMRRRLQVERDLADALAFRKAMEDSLVTGLRARDLQGRITYVNPAFCDMVGFTAEELMGQSVDAPYWPPELAEEYRQRQDTRLAGILPPREGFESVFMHKDGTRFPVLIIEAPLINAQSVQTGWMSAFLDIREQRRIEELSRASQERLQATARLAMVGEMASLLSHELNQPLAAISSYATGTLNLLRQGIQGPDDIELPMHRIAEQAERAGRVIKSVHDIVRRREQAREAVSPQALIDAVQPLISLQARKLGVRVEVRLEPDLPQVQCDRTMIEQVVLNLARNAMQAMDRPDIVSRVLGLSARRMPGRPRWLEFAVSDVGPGIAPEIEQQLFTPFFTTKAEGMGLGLSLCRTVIEQHRGTLAFEPNRPRGTVFTFTLPADEALEQLP